MKRRDTLLFVRRGSRHHKPKLSADCGESAKRNRQFAMREATRSFCILMLGFLDDYAGSTDPSVLEAVDYIRNLCELPCRAAGSVIANSQELRDAVNVLAAATPAPATARRPRNRCRCKFRWQRK